MKDKIRKRRLPEGWYPDTENGVLSFIESRESPDTGIKGKSVIVPHAGWYFSGKIASNTIKQISDKSNIIVIAGGHLSEYDSVLIAEDEKFDTPLGSINNSIELREKILDLDIVKTDRIPDNTVEIQLPFVKYYFPDAQIIWLRMPPDYEKIKKISALLSEYEKTTDNRISVIGSTDLTHYGINYGFMSHGNGEEALSWVKNVNDKEYLDFLLEFKIKHSLEHSIKNRSACSSGGAALSALFAKDSGCTASKLLYYYTSNDIYPSDSFVGYTGIIYY